MLAMGNMLLDSVLCVVLVMNFAKCPTTETCIIDLMFLCFLFCVEKMNL